MKSRVAKVSFARGNSHQSMLGECPSTTFAWEDLSMFWRISIGDNTAVYRELEL
jgi:hypothetical protein